MGIKFEKIKAGMTLYDVRKEKMGNTTMSRTGVWKVRVMEVNPSSRQVLASWNGNSPKWYREYSITKFRKSPPEWLPTMSFRGDRYRCHMCGATTNTKSGEFHRETCTHPRAVSWRKKQAKAAKA